MQADLPAPELTNILSNALLFVDKTKTAVPGLRGILLLEVNGNLSAMATDRYRIAEILAEAGEVTEGFQLYISPDQAKAILAYIEPLAKEPHSAIRISNDGYTVEVDDLWNAADRGPLVFELVEDAAHHAKNLANVRRVFPTDRNDTEYGAIHVPIADLGSFARVKDRRYAPDKNDTFLIIPGDGERKQAFILRSDWFRGLLIPRLTGLWREAAAHNQRRFL